MGIKEIHASEVDTLKKANNTPKEVQHVPLNKVGDFFKGEDGKITLPIDYNNVKTSTILLIAVLGLPLQLKSYVNHGENLPLSKHE